MTDLALPALLPLFVRTAFPAIIADVAWTLSFSYVLYAQLPSTPHATSFSSTLQGAPPQIYTWAVYSRVTACRGSAIRGHRRRAGRSVHRPTSLRKLNAEELEEFRCAFAGRLAGLSAAREIAPQMCSPPCSMLLVCPSAAAAKFACLLAACEAPHTAAQVSRQHKCEAQRAAPLFRSQSVVADRCR